ARRARARALGDVPAPRAQVLLEALVGHRAECTPRPPPLDRLDSRLRKCRLTNIGERRTDGWTALGDPTRRAIFERLAEGPRAVGDLARGLPVSRPAVSQH